MEESTVLQVLARELNHLKQQHKALRQASQLCCFGLQMQFVTVSDGGPLETIAENKKERSSRGAPFGEGTLSLPSKVP